MRLVEDRGWETALVTFPGGDLLVMGGVDDRVHLHPRGEATYLHEGKDIHLNPHFTFHPPSRVEVERDRDGRPGCMAFYAGGDEEWLPAASTEALCTDLCAALNAEIASDPDLAAFLERTCAEAGVQKAKAAADTAARAYARAAHALSVAQARVSGIEADFQGPACHVVTVFPKDTDEPAGSRIDDALETLLAEVSGGAGIASIVRLQRE